jgi:hypothetical protein
MLINVWAATSEVERRYAFVSEGAQSVRWLKRLVMERFRIYRDRLLQAAGDAVNALGAWLRRRGRLDSAHS